MSAQPPLLHAVTEGERPAGKSAPKSLTAALDGSSRDLLAAMRRALAKKLDNDEVASNSISSTYKELRELDRLIRAIDASEEGEHDEGGDSHDRRAFDAAAI